MSHTVRSVLTATRKRKDREESSSFYNSNTSSGKGIFGNSQFKLQPPNLPNTTSSNNNNNQLLAGYMAHEFLTRGTLFGQKFDPARAEAVPLAAADSKRKPGRIESGSGTVKQPKQEMARSYAEVAHLLKSDGAHIPGVVNPTQLARWIQM